MKKSIIIGLFLLCAAVQLFLSVSMVIDRENILRRGSLHKFHTEPVDPYDPFRGKYVALEINGSVKTSDYMKYEEGEKVFVVLKKDADGFSSLSEIAERKPDGNDFIRLKIDQINNGEISFHIPFDRYYIDEDYAEEAETAYWTGIGENSAYIEVRILKGRAVLRELFFADKPVLDYLKS
ncbi:MAG: GDYXXLXY domain-containing protein [Spirochaetales bacterium]|nr:GDYXXLXY domain-containing protein [Spirochaetales bacterium]